MSILNIHTLFEFIQDYSLQFDIQNYSEDVDTSEYQL